MDNTLRTRISLKYDTAENWKTSTLQLDKGEVIVYAGENGEYNAICLGTSPGFFGNVPCPRTRCCQRRWR